MYWVGALSINSTSNSTLNSYFSKLCTNQHFPNHLWNEREGEGRGGEGKGGVGRGEGQSGDGEGTDGKVEVPKDA